MRAYRFSPPQTVLPGRAGSERKAASFWVSRTMAVVVAALGWYSLEAAANQGSRVGEAVLMPVIAASLTGFGLLVTVIDLWYRKRVGWLMAMVLLYTLALVELLSG